MMSDGFCIKKTPPRRASMVIHGQHTPERFLRSNFCCDGRKAFFSLLAERSERKNPPTLMGTRFGPPARLPNCNNKSKTTATSALPPHRHSLCRFCPRAEKYPNSVNQENERESSRTEEKINRKKRFFALLETAAAAAAAAIRVPEEEERQKGILGSFISSTREFAFPFMFGAKLRENRLFLSISRKSHQGQSVHWVGSIVRFEV